MSNKDIQENRIRSFFIESTKATIKGEGIKAVSARNIAKEAGYSYATIYNYFADLKELFTFCVVDFIVECKDFVNNVKHPEKAGKEAFISKTKTLCNYFIQYPGIFELMFTEQMPELRYNEKINAELDSLFIYIFGEEYKRLSKKRDLDIKIISELHRSIIMGLLSKYLLRRTPSEYKEFISVLEQCVKYI
jgi:AcrR family transcriptional regulator